MCVGGSKILYYYYIHITILLLYYYLSYYYSYIRICVWGSKIPYNILFLYYYLSYYYSYMCVFPLVTPGQRVIDLTLSDAPANERGFLIATLVNTRGVADSGPVCGEVDLLTAWITCLNLGWLFTTGYSTTSRFG